jgi:hypothetical protein
VVSAFYAMTKRRAGCAKKAMLRVIFSIPEFSECSKLNTKLVYFVSCLLPNIIAGRNYAARTASIREPSTALFSAAVQNCTDIEICPF